MGADAATDIPTRTFHAVIGGRSRSSEGRKKMFRSSAAILAATVAFGLTGLDTTADAGPKHCPPGHAKKGWCEPGVRYDRDRRRDRDFDEFRTRRDVQDALDDAYDAGYREGRRDGFRVGQHLDRPRYRVLDRDLYLDRYGRRLDDGYYYAEADGRQLLIDAATGVILDILSR